MDYIELSVPVADAAQAEIVTAFLADFPFESFREERGVLKAYIPKDRLADCKWVRATCSKPISNGKSIPI